MNKDITEIIILVIASLCVLSALGYLLMFVASPTKIQKLEKRIEAVEKRYGS